eukprot:1183411-Prorocentrum_minimum.AAC.3
MPNARVVCCGGGLGMPRAQLRCWDHAVVRGGVTSSEVMGTFSLGRGGGSRPGSSSAEVSALTGLSSLRWAQYTLCVPTRYLRDDRSISDAFGGMALAWLRLSSALSGRFQVRKLSYENLGFEQLGRVPSCCST